MLQHNAILDLFSDRQFADFRRTIDSEMNHLHSEGIGTTVKRVEPITKQEEENVGTFLS